MVYWLYPFVCFEPSFAKASEAKRTFTPELAEGSPRTEIKNLYSVSVRPEPVEGNERIFIIPLKRSYQQMIIFNSHKTIETLKQFLPDNPVIVEAGAFDGNDTIKMATQWPNASIHAFEPVPEIYERLLNNTKKFSNISYYPYALSDHTGEALFHISERLNRLGVASQAGSLHKPKEALFKSSMIFPRTTTVHTITLDKWVVHNNISTIDLLWLDTQGHELAIVQAASSIIAHIGVVLAEVSFIERYENQPLYEDVVAWMTSHGFDYVGRDFADTTTTSFGNALFVRK